MAKKILSDLIVHAKLLLHKFCVAPDFLGTFIHGVRNSFGYLQFSVRIILMHVLFFWLWRIQLLAYCKPLFSLFDFYSVFSYLVPIYSVDAWYCCVIIDPEFFCFLVRFQDSDPQRSAFRGLEVYTSYLIIEICIGKFAKFLQSSASSYYNCMKTNLSQMDNVLNKYMVFHHLKST